MDVARLSTTIAMGKMNVPRGKSEEPGTVSEIRTRKASAPEIDKTHLKAALDNIIRDTRFQYVLKEELDYFVVRIIDKETDKVIREIPSKELQNVHEGIARALGILFDEVI